MWRWLLEVCFERLFRVITLWKRPRLDCHTRDTCAFIYVKQRLCRRWHLDECSDGVHDILHLLKPWHLAMMAFKMNWPELKMAMLKINLSFWKAVASLLPFVLTNRWIDNSYQRNFTVYCILLQNILWTLKFEILKERCFKIYCKKHFNNTWAVIWNVFIFNFYILNVA